MVVRGFLFDTISAVAEHLFGPQFEDLQQLEDKYYKQHYYDRSVMGEYGIIAQDADPCPNGGTRGCVQPALYL